MSRTVRTCAIFAVGVLVAGMVSGWVAGSGYGNPWFDRLAKPWFMPPGWVFPVAWTTLYLLMGAAAGLVYCAPDSVTRRRGLILFAMQLLLNLAWSPIFFAAHRIDAALAVIVLLDVVVVATIFAFFRVRPVAALLMLPYPCWLALATALNGSILGLNP